MTVVRISSVAMWPREIDVGADGGVERWEDGKKRKSSQLEIKE
jgi:hypothetical protein